MGGRAGVGTAPKTPERTLVGVRARAGGGASQWVRCAHTLAFLQLAALGASDLGGRGACRWRAMCTLYPFPFFPVPAPTNCCQYVDAGRPPTPLTIAIILYVVCPTNCWKNMFHILTLPLAVPSLPRARAREQRPSESVHRYRLQSCSLNMQKEKRKPAPCIKTHKKQS